ncbi:MAG: hypothetical protein NWS57_02220, partial [Burkholderiaceae bacterium]|nr:hypothetical protein [Burkholderiaceae bacterium]
MMWQLRVLVIMCCLTASPVSAQALSATQALDLRQKKLDQDRESLRARIQSMQVQLETRDQARQQAADQLKISEAAISKLIRQIKVLETELKQSQSQLKTLTIEVQAQRQVMLQSRDRLASQLRAQYSSGLSPWSALLAGENPQALGRELGYLDYVSQARSKAIQTLTNDVARLNELEQEEKNRRDVIERNLNETDDRKLALVKQRKEKASLLARLEDDIRLQKAEMNRLGQNEKRLTDLVKSLEVQLQAQRDAEEKTAQEAARQEQVARVDQAKQAKLAQQALKKSDQEMQAQATEAEQPLSTAKSNDDQLLEKDKKIDQARLAQARKKQQQEALARQQAVLSTLPNGGGIKRGMSPPVPGQVMARF